MSVLPSVRGLILLAACASILVGCGKDPILAQAEKEAAGEKTVVSPTPGTAPSAAGAPPGGAPNVLPAPAGAPGGAPGAEPVGKPGAEGLPGVPDEPAPGDPSQPPPSGVDPGKGIGHTVNLAGEIVFPDYKSGAIRVDVFDGDQRDLKARPRVVAVTQIANPGMFTVGVPESAKKVWISAFNDENQNSRPDPKTDPTGFYEKNPIDVTAGPVSDIVIKLERLPPPNEGQ